MGNVFCSLNGEQLLFVRLAGGCVCVEPSSFHTRRLLVVSSLEHV